MHLCYQGFSYLLYFCFFLVFASTVDEHRDIVHIFLLHIVLLHITKASSTGLLILFRCAFFGVANGNASHAHGDGCLFVLCLL